MQNVTTDNMLGIKVDSHLSWKDQIDNVAGTLSSGIGLLQRIKDYLATETTITYYKTFLQPHTGVRMAKEKILWSVLV